MRLHRTPPWTGLLAVPQEIRSEIARRVFAGVGSKYFSTISSTPVRLHRLTTFLPLPPLAGQIRQQSTVSPSEIPTSVVKPPFEPRPSEKSPRPSRLLRLLTTSTLIVVFFSAGLAMAAAPAAEAVNGFVNPPSDEETLDMYVPGTVVAAEVNEYITNHPLAQRLRQESTMSESRPHLKIPPAMRPHNLTAGTLLGPGMIEIPPLIFNEKSTELPKLVQFVYLGQGLCGHPGIVHGGLLATLLDEGLARCCFPALPNKVGVTASLKIDYRQPCPGDTYAVLKAETTKVEGRKVWAKGWIEILGAEDGTGVKLVEAEGLFIEPKNAKNMARIYSTQ